MGSYAWRPYLSQDVSKRSYELARMVAKEYRQHGRKAAERLLVSYSIKALVNS